MTPAKEIYDLMIDRLQSLDAQYVEEIIIGLTWTLCRIRGDNLGLTMSPGIATRTLPWSGTLVGKSTRELAHWIRGWDPYQSTIAMAAINATLNSQSELLHSPYLLPHFVSYSLYSSSHNLINIVF